MNEPRRPEMGDTVRIAATAETRAAGYADRMGTCFGFTTPSITGVRAIGPGLRDDAIAVGFDDGTQDWFDPSLVTFLDVNAGQVWTFGDKKFTRTATGEWIEAPASN